MNRKAAMLLVLAAALLLLGTQCLFVVQQSQQALNAISFCFIWLPVIVYAIVAAIMCFYRKYEKMEPMIKEEIAVRRAREVEEVAE